MYKYTANATTVVNIQTCGSTFDTQLYVFSDPSQPPLVGNADSSCTHNSQASSTTTSLLEGQSYWIVVNGSSSDWVTAQGLYTLTVSEVGATS